MAPNCREFRFESGPPANKHFEKTYNDKAINQFLQYVYSVTTQERIENECILSMCKKENLFRSQLFSICIIKTFGIFRTGDYILIKSLSMFRTEMTQNSTKDASQKV